MIINVIDSYKLMKRHACWGNIKTFQKNFDVIAIRKRRSKWQYLVEYDRQLNWWDKDLFIVIDEAVPKNWLYVEYGRFHKYKNKKYDFEISTSCYHGPKEFLQNENFFFDIYENPRISYEFYIKTCYNTGDGNTGDNSAS